MTELTEAIRTIKASIPDPSRGLPNEVFYFITEITPMINVDLLIKDEKGRTLLSWRDDQHTGKGWHIPGGIIRFQESLEARIQKVAETEIGRAVEHDPIPMGVHEIIDRNKTIRGHFISLLYRCSFSSTFTPDNKGLTEQNPGYLKWHDSCPTDLLSYHEIYRKYI